MTSGHTKLLPTDIKSESINKNLAILGRERSKTRGWASKTDQPFCHRNFQPVEKAPEFGTFAGI